MSAVNAGDGFSQAVLNTLAGIANGKAILQASGSFYPYSFGDWFHPNPLSTSYDSASSPGWLSEHNNLRSDMDRASQLQNGWGLDGGTFGNINSSVSAFWPQSGLNINGLNNIFFYSASSAVGSVNISIILPNGISSINWAGPVANLGAGFDQALNMGGGFMNGGNENGFLCGDFVQTFEAYNCSTATQALGLVTVNQDLGLGTFEKWALYTPGFASQSYQVFCVWHVSQSIPPNVSYLTSVSGTPSSSNAPYPFVGAGAFAYSQAQGMFPGQYLQYASGSTSGSGQGPSLSKIYNTSFLYDGICSGLNVYGIPCGYTPPTFIGFWQAAINGGTPPPQPPGPIFSQSEGSIGVSATPQPGFWGCNTSWVSEIETVPYSDMPWNQTRTHGPPTSRFTYNPMLQQSASLTAPVNTYNVSLPCENQSEPPVWAASTQFTPGFVILDSNYNYQQVVKSAVVGSPNWGSSSASTPTWATSLGGFTGDGQVSWSLIHLNQGPPGQQSITPAQHRINGQPRYPVYWINESASYLKPPTTNAVTEWTIFGTGNQWARNPWGAGSNFDFGWRDDGMANGWFIYAISLNRYGIQSPYNPAETIPNPGGSIQVTPGCMRNGVFVPFNLNGDGPFFTGHTYQLPYGWYIFSSDAIVYQCSERIDFQALAIGAVTVGAQIAGQNTPGGGELIVNAFYNDTLANLSFLT